MDSNDSEIVITIRPVDGFVKSIFDHLQTRIRELEDENARLKQAMFSEEASCEESA